MRLNGWQHRDDEFFPNGGLILTDVGKRSNPRVTRDCRWIVIDCFKAVVVVKDDGNSGIDSGGNGRLIRLREVREGDGVWLSRNGGEHCRILLVGRHVTGPDDLDVDVEVLSSLCGPVLDRREEVAVRLEEGDEVVRRLRLPRHGSRRRLTCGRR